MKATKPCFSFDVFSDKSSAPRTFNLEKAVRSENAKTRVKSAKLPDEEMKTVS